MLNSVKEDIVNVCNLYKKPRARFNDIYRADELKAAAVFLEAWRRKTAAEKRTAYATASAVAGGKRVNRGTRICFVQPFGAPDNFWYETKALAPATDAAIASEETATALITAVRDAVLPYALSALPPGATHMSVQAKKVRFAKVRCTEKSGAGVVTKSRLTDRPYTKYNSNTVSSPFGSGIVIKQESLVRTVLKNILVPSAAPPAGRSIGFTPQGNLGNIAKAPLT